MELGVVKKPTNTFENRIKTILVKGNGTLI